MKLNLVFYINSITIIIDTDITRKKLFRGIVDIYIYILGVHIVPFITLIFINALTVHCLLQYRDEHLRLLSNSVRQMTMTKTDLAYSRRHFHVTIMLIAAVTLFLLCRFPILIDQIYEVRYSIMNDEKPKQNIHFRCRIQPTFVIFANVMQTINCNGNLIIYLLCSQNFRDVSKELLEKLLNYTRVLLNENALLMISRRPRGDTRTTDI